MTSVRYGAREQQVNHEIAAKKADIWSEAVTAVYETDPDIIAAVLPPPLVPGPAPLVRITITRVEMPGLPVFGAGWIGVQARHGDRLGEYPIFMPMTTEQSTIGGRETNGEPKKLAEVEVTRDGDHVEARIGRMGFDLCEITGRVNEARDNYEMEKTDFWFKLSPSPEAPGQLDQDPLLLYGEKTERTRVHEGIEGELILKESPLDPIADLVVRRMVDLNWTERASTQVGRIIGSVPRADLAPFLHQRYDDLSVLGGKAMSDRYTIISADAHAGLPCEKYRPYLDQAYHPQFDEYLAERHANREQQLQMNYDYIMGWETDNEEGLRGAWDIEQRDKELDADGVSAEVMFADADAITGMASPPFGAGLSAGAIADPELAFAGARAHNRFLADMCSRSPERHGGIALVPITHSVERAVAEIEWLAEQPGIRGVMVPTMWHHLQPYNHPDYDPVWAACQAAGFPVHTHSGEAPQDEYNNNVGIYLAEVVWWAARPMWHLLFSGVFERFPRLKYVVTEAAAYWAADMMWKWDQYMGGGHTTKKMAALLKGKISKLPSDYFGENLFIGASTMSKEEIRRRYVLGCDVVMWGTDYPHPEGTWPHTQERLRGDFGGIPVEDTRQLLGETAARCYGFDLDALRPIAERIGPTPADLGQDPTLRTDPEAVRTARWWKDEYHLERAVKPAGLVLTPGASARRDQSGLVAIDAAVTGLGLAVERVEFPGQASGKRRTDPPAVCMEVVRTAAAALAERLSVPVSRIAVGGRSFGGRMCSLAVAEGLRAAALVLVSYPLHPPGRPERLRTEHFGQLDLPCLFVSGRRDAFATPEELERETKAIPGPVTLNFVNGDHSLRTQEAAAAELVAAWLADLS